MIACDDVSQCKAVCAGNGGVKADRFDPAVPLLPLIADSRPHASPGDGTEVVPVQVRTPKPCLYRKQIPEYYNIKPLIGWKLLHPQKAKHEVQMLFGHKPFRLGKRTELC